MKKNIVRGSMLAVAALSLLIGGTSYTSSLKDQVSDAPAIISKAIENSADAGKTLAKGVAVQEVAEATTEATTETVTETTTEEVVAVQEAVVEKTEQNDEVEHKKASIGSNQVVANIESYLNIRSDASEEAEVVGKFYNGNVGTIVEKGEEWSVVTSGNAYGYVKNDYLLFGEEAESYIENNCDQVAKVTAETLNVRAEESTESEVVTQSDEGDALTILGQDNGWFKVAVTKSNEEGAVEDKVGYVSSDYVYVDYAYGTAVTIEEEEAALAAEAAEEEAQAEQEASQTPTTESPTTEAPTTEAPTTQAPTTEAPTTEAPKKETPKKETPKKETPKKDKPKEESSNKNSNGTTGQDVADYAVQFVGNPYVYGGTSLTKGADCSGFVQSVYKHFGYSLSRTSYSQPNDGKKVSVKNIQPGDLLFYHNFGHVAIYIGGGQVVHASNRKTGIKISNYDYSPIDKAVRIIY